MNDLISVIVPIYKVEKYINKCVNSIMAQTYKNIEIILIDDGSPDKCGDICDEFEKKDLRIKVIHKENGGQGSARNAGLDVAKGLYVVFVDSDDYIPEDAIEKMYNQILNDDSDMVIGQYTKIYPDESKKECELNIKEKMIFSREEAMNALHTHSSPLHCCACAKLYQKKIFESLRFTSTIFEDSQIWPRIINKCTKISAIPDSVYFYFQRDDSTVHSLTDDKRVDGVKVALDISKFFYDNDNFKEAYFYYRWSIMQTLKIENKEHARKLIKEAYTREEIQRLHDLDIKAKLCYVGMYFPFIHKLISFLKY